MSSRKPGLKSQPAWARYGVAIGAVAAGWLAREGLTPAVGKTGLPFIFFFPAIAMAAWYGGFGPGAVAALLSAVAADWFLLQPVHTLTVSTLGDGAALAAFLVSCLFIIGAMEAMHRARGRALAELTERERLEAELGRVREMFATTLGSVVEVAGATDAPSRGPFPGQDAGAAKPSTRLIAFIFAAAAILVLASAIFVYRVGLIRVHAQTRMT